MIALSHLTKQFGQLKAVDDFSLNVMPGEVLGLLGPNGAGKTTTMKMITGFLAPTSGTVRILGEDIEQSPIEAKQKLGYLPEGAPLYGDMSVESFLIFVGQVRQLKSTYRRERQKKVIEDLHLGSVLHQRIDTLSKGFKRRVGLAQAILHDPKVLILDEPTDGLDPNQKHEVRELIFSLAKDKIVIISTHLLEEVTAVCSRAVIIHQGRKLLDCTPSELLKLSRYHQAVTLVLEEPGQIEPVLADIPELDTLEIVDDSRFILIPRQGKTLTHSVSQLIHEHRWRVSEFHVEPGRLDEVFRRLTTSNQQV